MLQGQRKRHEMPTEQKAFTKNVAFLILFDPLRAKILLRSNDFSGMFIGKMETLEVRNLAVEHSVEILHTRLRD